MIIRRSAFDLVSGRLGYADAVVILGPRQVGKTTLARAIADEMEHGAIYLDLESEEDRAKLTQAGAFFAQHSEKLIVLDEVQRAPEIFEVLRGQIDARRRIGERGGKFLILGSASMDLLRQSSESLAGRVSYVFMNPLAADEAISHSMMDDVASVDFISQPAASNQLADSGRPGLVVQGEITDLLWLRGGFPKSYLSRKGSESMQWRLDFIRTYLERDVPQYGFRIPFERLEAFCQQVAVDQGGAFNAERYGRSIGVSSPTIASYAEILEKLLLVRRLQPWSENMGKRLVKSPRLYVRDSGLLHALLAIRTLEDLKSHSMCGKSWEGFVVESLVNAGNERLRPYYYRTSAGAEIDLLLEFGPGKVWAVEIKRGRAGHLKPGFHSAADDVGAMRRILVHGNVERFTMSGGVEAMPLLDALSEVRATIGEG